uniref:UMOD/GP2/OIT3-like D8C domain-containing protein n=1 Tax=Scleropages formosus TaxID=113540 RepID=A0A8C9SDC1_SCLFO
ARGAACVFPFVYRGNTYHAYVCLSHITLSDPWRNVAFDLTSFSGYPKCDHGLAEDWYRFTGIGGDVLPESCVLSNRGGTDTPLWLNDSHPPLGVGVRGINVCSTSQDKCCSGTFMMNVLACPEGYYVYYLGQPSCSQSFKLQVLSPFTFW